jgi:hypothetical protein
MVRNTLISLLGAFVVTAATAYGGLYKIEVPADLTKEDVLNPTAYTADRLDALLREELAKNPGAVEFEPVAFTKNGEIISPTVEHDVTYGWGNDRLGFEPALNNYLTS